MDNRTFGLKYTVVVNYVMIGAYFLIAALTAFRTLPTFRGIQESFDDAPEETQNLIETIMSLGMELIIVSIIFAIVLLFVTQKLKAFTKTGYTFQIIMSILLGVVGYPILTIVYGVSLYYFLFDQKTKDLFKKSP